MLRRRKKEKESGRRRALSNIRARAWALFLAVEETGQELKTFEPGNLIHPGLDHVIERVSAVSGSSSVIAVTLELASFVAGDRREISMATIPPPTQEEEGEDPSPQFSRRVWLFTHSQMLSSILGSQMTKRSSKRS